MTPTHSGGEDQPADTSSQPGEPPSPRRLSGSWVDPETGTLHLAGHRFEAWDAPRPQVPAHPEPLDPPLLASSPESVVAATEWSIRPARPNDPFSYALHLRDEFGAGASIPMDPATLKSLRAAFDQVHAEQHYLVTGTYPSPQPAAVAREPSTTSNGHVPVPHRAPTVRAAEHDTDGDDMDAPEAMRGPIGWFLRHKILGFLLAVVAVCVLISAITGSTQI